MPVVAHAFSFYFDQQARRGVLPPQIQSALVWMGVSESYVLLFSFAPLSVFFRPNTLSHVNCLLLLRITTMPVLLVIVICFVYSCISPLILPVGAVFFLGKLCSRCLALAPRRVLNSVP